MKRKGRTDGAPVSLEEMCVVALHRCTVALFFLRDGDSRASAMKKNKSGAGREKERPLSTAL